MAAEWRIVDLGDICALHGGSAFKPAYQGRASGDFPFIKVSDMNLAGNEIRIQGATNWVDSEDLAPLKASPLPNGTVVFAKIGEGLRQNRVRRLTRDTIIDNNMMGAVPREDAVLPEYLYYAMAQIDLASVAYGTALPYLTAGSVAGLSVPLPPLPEQRAIAHILGTLDDKIENNRRMSATLEQMARALYKAWFVDFEPVRAKMAGRPSASAPGDLADLFPDRLVDSELGQIPEGWRVGTIGSLCELAYGKALKASGRQAGTVPVIGSKGQTGWHNTALVEGPGIVVGRKGNPGAVTWVTRDFFPIDTTFYVVAKRQQVPLEYLYYALDAVQLARLSADSAVPGLNRNAAYSASLLEPPRQLLVVFTEVARSNLERAGAAEQEGETLAVMRDTLLPRLLSGDVRIEEAEFFVEGAS